jgi:hypothetical protein
MECRRCFNCVVIAPPEGRSTVSPLPKRQFIIQRLPRRVIVKDLASCLIADRNACHHITPLMSA